MNSGGWQALAALARAGGFAALAPTLGLSDNPVKHRVILAILLFLVLFPITTTPAEGAAATDPIAPVVLGLATGCLIGFAVRSLLVGITMASQLVEHQLGFSLITDPDDEAAAGAISRLYQLTAAAVFFALGGHRLVVASLMGPDAGIDWAALTASDVLDLSVSLIWNACWLAVRLAVPVVMALLVSSLAVGMIARVVPHISGNTIVLPVHVAFGLVLILLSLATLVPAVRFELARALNLLR